MGQNRQELEKVQEVAKVLGITLGSCKVGSRRHRVEKKKLVEEEAKVDEEMEEDEQVDEVDEEKGHVEQYDQLKEQDKKEEQTIKVEVTESRGTHEYSCTECGKQFKHQGHFKRHKLSHTNNCNTSIQPSEALICSHCSDTFRNSKKLAKHLLKEHDDKKLLSNSEDNVKSGIRLPCTECDKTFSRADKLSKHNKDKHQEQDIIRKDITESENSIKADSEKLYQCKNCEKSFRNDKQRYKHNSSIHSGIAIICADCDKNFSRRDKLNVHRRKKHSMEME